MYIIRWHTDTYTQMNKHAHCPDRFMGRGGVLGVGGFLPAYFSLQKVVHLWCSLSTLGQPGVICVCVCVCVYAYLLCVCV